MRNAERAGRVVAALWVGSLAIALAGCGGSDGTGSTGTSGTSSTNLPTVAETATSSSGPNGSGTTTGGSSSTSGGSTTPPPATASTSSITFSWQPPTENTDGTPLRDLVGYKIHYGTTSADYTQVVSIDNAGLTRYVLENLAKGTYYFAITALNSHGLESQLSGEVIATLN